MDYEAAQCRRQAVDFAGQPEAAFLLSVAAFFDELAKRADSAPRILGPIHAPSLVVEDSRNRRARARCEPRELSIANVKDD